MASTVIFLPANSRETGHSSLASPITATKAVLSSPGRGLAVQNEDVLLTDASGKHVAAFLEPDKLGFAVANTPG